MALTPEEQEKLNKLLKEGIELARKLGDEAQAISLSQYRGDLKTAERAVESLRKEWKEYTSDIEGARLGFSRIVEEMKNMNTGTGKATTAFRGMQSIAAKLQYHQEGITKLSQKELKQLKSKFEQKQKDLNLAQRLLADEIKGLEQKERRGEDVTAQLNQARAKQEEINNELKDTNSFSAQFTEQIKEQIKEQKKLEKKLGAFGELLKGISKIPLVGNLVDSQEALDKMEDTLKETGSPLKSFGAGLKNIGGQIKSGILNPINLASMAITQLIEALKITDTGAGDMAKKMNMTYEEALATRRELGNMAAMSGDVALNTKNLQETYMAIGQSLGSNAMASKETLETFTKLREQAGYTNEQLTELNKLSLVNNKSLEKNTKEILGGAKAYASRKGLVINEKDILNDVVKASASLKLSLGGSADKLAESAVKARAVGLNLEQAAAMADQLLNFESSIENELSAELLTGKDLNLERARTLALNGDIAGAAEEIAKQVGTSAQFAEMNVIQQEALAKAAGLTRDQLAQSLIDKEALAKLSAKEGENAQQAFNRLVKEVGMEEAKKRLGDEALANQFQQQSVQERFNQAVEKLQELFIQIAEPVLAILSPLMDLVSFVLPAINILLQPIIGAFQAIASTVKGIIKLLKGDFSGSLAAFKEAGGGLKTMVFGGGNEVTAKGTTANDLISLPLTSLPHKISYMNDGASLPSTKPGYGSRTLFGPEGAIQLNNKDTVIAGTDLFKKGDDVMSAPKGAITVANSTAPKKETPTNPNSETNTLLSQLIKGQKEVNAIPTLRIQ